MNKKDNKKKQRANKVFLSDYPKAMEFWDYEKNQGIDPKLVSARSHQKRHWKCPEGKDHEWISPVARITQRLDKQGKPCPVCSGFKVVPSNCLATTHPKIADSWHPTKNGELTPYMVTAGCNQKVWWKCSEGEDHEWDATVNNRVKQGCPYCSGRRVSKTNSLGVLFPNVAAEWHPTKNGELTPYTVTAGCNHKVWWLCSKGHEYMTKVYHRALSESSCPYCSGHKLTYENSLEFKRPDLAKEWHPTKNGSLEPSEIHCCSREKVWWLCSKDPSHEWESTIDNRNKGNGCSFCNLGWTVERIRKFVLSLLPLIDSLREAELYVICLRSGILDISGYAKGKSFVKALSTGKFPKDELEKFVKKKPSLVDDFLNDSNVCLGECEEDLNNKIHCLSERDIQSNGEELPVIQAKDILAKVDSTVFPFFGEADVCFFIRSAVEKIWRHVFVDENTCIHQVEQYKINEGLYSNQVRTQFLEEYQEVKSLSVPKGYSFIREGIIQQPNLMQLYTAYLIKKRKRLGNWSGTGAGKTLAAVLSSRVIDAKLTIICCPNNVVDGWKKMIKEAYPDSNIFVKNVGLDSTVLHPTYLILNYEFFQSIKGRKFLNKFVETNQVDFVVIDEIHFSKQRDPKNISIRKQVISAFLDIAKDVNSNLCVLGMSATPVINNLFEGKTLLELVTGKNFGELKTNATVPNCITLFQQFVTHGIRFCPRYNQSCKIVIENIDCSAYISNIKELGIKPSADDIDGILVKAKTPYILDQIRPKTLIYVHYWNKNGVLIELKKTIEKQGWKVGVFTSETKEGLVEFIEGDTDVLIASSCISTGVDGIQHVCSRLIIASLPWTHAEFEQLKGRIYRQGQKCQCLEVIVPLTYANVNDVRWSYCESRWNLIQFKKSVSEASVDGVIPEGHLPTQEQVVRATVGLLRELSR